MRLLIVTQKVDREDDLLGFFHQWIAEFARKCDSVVVICLQKGVVNLPDNVKVFSLGKENSIYFLNIQFVKKLLYGLRFYFFILRELKNYDAVFVHMNTIYLSIPFVSLIWKFFRKKIALWHVHFEVNQLLEDAVKKAHVVFTTTPDGCRIQDKKVRPIGHGILFSKFKYDRKEGLKEPIKILYAGKITWIKGVHTLLRAADILKRTWNKKFSIYIVGPTTTNKDEEYKRKLQEYINEKNLSSVVFLEGRVPHRVMLETYYKPAQLIVNMCPTGGWDKVVLEGMATKAIPVVSNEAFSKVFGRYRNDLIFPHNDHEALAEKIKAVCASADDKILIMRQYLYRKAILNSSLQKRIQTIVEELQSLCNGKKPRWLLRTRGLETQDPQRYPRSNTMSSVSHTMRV